MRYDVVQYGQVVGWIHVDGCPSKVWLEAREPFKPVLSGIIVGPEFPRLRLPIRKIDHRLAIDADSVSIETLKQFRGFMPA